MRKLVIAEKPSVARDIAKVLKCSKNGNGYLYNDEYIVSWAVGHLVTLCEPDEYDEKYKKWKMETLPIIPEHIKIKAIKNTVDQYNILKKMLKSDDIESIICATDSGREGELIFRYIYELSGCDKPFKRLWISSMTAQAIKEGFEKLKDGSEYDNLYHSAKCRSEADWLVGINASRAYTIKYNTLLSIGRVQTPTLAIIVARQKEIDSFVVSEYWEVQADFGEYKGQWFEIKTDGDKKIEETKILDKTKVNEIAKKVKGKMAEVKSVECEEKRNPPPLLYDLTELQRDCNRKFGFSAQQTLSIVQDLYEKRKMVTYPRTDSRYLSDDMIPKLKIIAGKLMGTENYNKYAEYVVNLSKLPITKRIVDNTKLSDHHAIIPTEVNPRVNALSDAEFKVYDLIARRFLQVFYPYYVYNTTKIVTECEDERFVTRGTTVVDKGWTELNVKYEKEKKTEEVLPDVNEGDNFETKNAKAAVKKTKPPQAYNEATLLSAMENAGRFVEDEALKEQLKESGLGTPATRAAIIERLIKVGYVTRKGKSLVPTEKGMKLIEIVPVEMKSPETTGKWEKGLTSIAKGKMDTEKFMGSIKRYVNYIVGAAQSTQCKVIFAAEKAKGKNAKNVLGVCPNCKGHILENSKGYFCSNWKQGCKFTIWKNALENYGVAIDNVFVKNILENGKVENLSVHKPDTQEECTCTVILKEDNSGRIEISNLKKV